MSFLYEQQDVPEHMKIGKYVLVVKHEQCKNNERKPKVGSIFKINQSEFRGEFICWAKDLKLGVWENELSSATKISARFYGKVI